MAFTTQNERLLDRVILLFLFALFLLLSPLVDWWSAYDSVWFAPYLIWLLLIGALYWLQRRRQAHHDV